MSLIYRLKIFLLRVIGYEKPLRVAILKYFTIKFRQFRPHYETIMLESVIEAKKLNYDEITFIELGVAGGNGIVALEKYKTKIQKIYNIKIKIFGFDYGEGLPNSENTFDLKYLQILYHTQVEIKYLHKIKFCYDHRNKLYDLRCVQELK